MHKRILSSCFAMSLVVSLYAVSLTGTAAGLPDDSDFDITMTMSEVDKKILDITKKSLTNEDNTVDLSKEAEKQAEQMRQDLEEAKRRKAEEEERARKAAEEAKRKAEEEARRKELETQAGRDKSKTARSNNPLTPRKGVVYFNGHKETYYSQKVLPGGGLRIPGRHVAADGTIRDKDGYICVASSDLAKGTVVQTSLGTGKVYDCGCASGTIDIYTNW